MKKVRVRYPIPKTEDLEEVMKAHAKDMEKSLKSVMNIYIKGRRADIEKNLENIEKAKLRISKAQKCIEIAEEIVKENE